MNVILRRRKLGRASCRALKEQTVAPLRVVRSDKHIPKHIDTLIRWGCTAPVKAHQVINKAAAISEVGDKAGFRRKLNDAGLCPSTFFSLEEAEQAAQWPYIVRPAVHARGRYLALADDVSSLRQAYRAYGEGSYISAYVDKAEEYRVFVVQGRVIAVAKKTPGNPNAIAWNVSEGGKFGHVAWGDWPLRAVRVAVEGFNLSSLDFGGVDVMVDQEGRAYICEINSAPSLASPYRQACFSKAIDWMLENGRDRIPLVKKKGGWKKFIHPAISESAIMEEEDV